MRYIKFDDIDDKICIETTPIVSINIENRDYFFKVINHIKELDGEGIQYFDDKFRDLNLSKESVFVDSYLSLDLNEKKLLGQVYKEMETHLSSEELDEYNRIRDSLLSFAEKLSLNLEGEVEISDDLSLSKALSLVDLKFSEEDISNITSRFVQYIKIMSNLKPLHIIFTCDFLKYLNNDEILLLQEELKLREIGLFDISYCIDNRNKPIKCINLDEDLCEF